MAIIDIRNKGNGWLAVWIEALGEDMWLRPGERIRVEDDYTGTEPPFEITHFETDRPWAEGIAFLELAVNHGHTYVVTDGAGEQIQCGYQRPPHVAQAWMSPA